jgi:hypothetical protein
MSTSGHYHIPAIPETPAWAGEGVTDANGLLTLAFPAGRFSAAPVAEISRRGASSTTQYEYSVTAISATSISIAARKSTPVVVLTISVLGSSVVANAETLSVIARKAG